MKTMLSLTLLCGFLLALTGCVEDVHRHRTGRVYYHDRPTSTSYETRPVYRGDRHHFRDDGYYGRRDVRVYDTPRPPLGNVRVSF